MIDHDAIHDALRARMMTLVIATTGPIAIEATIHGFQRSSGSFIVDGFRRGMEIVSSGFALTANNVRSIITSISPTEIRAVPFVISIANNSQTISRPPLAVDASLPNRMLVAGLPIMRSFENEAPFGLATFTPIAGIPYLEEEFSPSFARTIGVPITTARIEAVGEFILKWHGIAGVGKSALRRSIDALQSLYSPGTRLSLGNSDAIIIDSDPAPIASPLLQTTTGPIAMLTIPWIVRSRNIVLA